MNKMSKQIEAISLEQAAKLALEALERLDGWIALRHGLGLTPQEKEIVTALREALMSGTDGAEQPAQQSAERGEPVAWMCSDDRLVSSGFDRFSACKSGAWNIPLYTTPQAQPAREPLTDEQIKEAVRGVGLSFTAPDFKVARAIEAAHGIKENT